MKKLNSYLIQISDIANHRKATFIDIDDLTVKLKWLTNELNWFNKINNNNLPLTCEEETIVNVIDTICQIQKPLPICSFLLELYVAMFMEEMYLFLTNKLNVNIKYSSKLNMSITGDTVVVSILE